MYSASYTQPTIQPPINVLKLAGVIGPSSLSMRTVSGPVGSAVAATAWVGASVAASVGACVAAGACVWAGAAVGVAAGLPHAARSRLINTRLLNSQDTLFLMGFYSGGFN